MGVPIDVADAVTQTQSPDRPVRPAGAEALAAPVADPRAVARSTEMLDDEDTAVVQTATKVLTLHGGDDGLARVARAFAFGDEQLTKAVSELADHVGAELA